MMSPEIDELFDNLTDPLKRDQYGRPLLIPGPQLTSNLQVRSRTARPDGKQPYTRASSLANYVADHSAIQTWQMRSLTKGLSDREDLAALGAALPQILGNTQDKKAMSKTDAAQDRLTNLALDEIAEHAMRHSNRDWKANWGTAIHGLTEPGVQGSVPKRMLADVQSWQQATAGWEFLATEMFVANDNYQAAGTFDHLVKIPWMPELGSIVVDKKTGLFHPDQCRVQLSVYANGQPYNPRTDARYQWPLLERPNNEWGIIAHIPLGQGRTDMYLVNLQIGHRDALLACDVRSIRSAKTPSPKIDPLGKRREQLADLLGLADDADTARAIFTANRDVWSDELTALARARLTA